jgi:hypothetical protein
VSYAPVEPNGVSGRRWDVGVPYAVRFAVSDRCEGRPAPNVPFDGLRASSDGPVEITLPEGLRSGRDGFAQVVVTCQAEAEEIALVIEDAADPVDRVDLFDRSLLDDTAPDCVS